MGASGRRLRSVLRALHVVFSIGWAGSVAVFLVVAAAGWASPDARIWAGVYAALQVTMWWAVVPLAGLSLLTGIGVSLVTRWGLTRHYWVLFKLVLTVVATGALVLHTGVADTAAHASLQVGMDFSAVRLQLMVDAVAALVVLVVAMILGFVKPRGTTPWAARPVS